MGNDSAALGTIIKHWNEEPGITQSTQEGENTANINSTKETVKTLILAQSRFLYGAAPTFFLRCLTTVFR